MDVQIAVPVRGTRRPLRWIDGRVEGDEEAIRRLEAVSERSEFPDLLEFLHAVEDAFGERPRFRASEGRSVVDVPDAGPVPVDLPSVEAPFRDLSSASRDR